MTEFFKLSGSGNDFLALVEPKQETTAESRRAWCRRGVSVGADGLFVLRRRSGAIGMEYFNADGLAADLCLNGTRCAAQLAFHLGWAEGSLSVETGAGAVRAHRLGTDRIALEVPVEALQPEPLNLPLGADSYSGYRVRVGVPHFVLPWPGPLGQAPILTVGRGLRHHAAFGPEGTNVNFVQFPNRHCLSLRTFERGVEDETLSCGSGVIASVATGLWTGELALPVDVETMGGFILRVEETAESGTCLFSGDARIVAQGEILAEAAIPARAPSWLEPT